MSQFVRRRSTLPFFAATRWVAIALVVAITGACSRRPSEYVVGAVGPQKLAYGVQQQRGIDLAVDEINRGGGINGVPLRVIARDDNGRGADAARIAAEFVGNQRIVAVIGHAGSAAEVAAARVYDAGKLTALGTVPSSPDLSGISPWVFRMITSDSVNGVTLARFASSLGASLHRAPRVAILYQNDAYGRGLTDAFLHSFNGQVVSADPLSMDIDPEPYITFVRQTKPDLVFVASDEDLGLRILREARRQHVTSSFLGGDGWQGLVTDSASRGVFIGTPFTTETTDTAGRRFVAEFRARYGTDPDATAALAYDATRLIGRALAHAGASRAGVRSYLASLSSRSSFPSLSGPMWFASNNDPAGDTFRMTRATNGVLTPLATQ